MNQHTLKKGLFLLLLVIQQNAKALPLIDAALDIDSPTFGYRPVVYSDDTDPDLFYLPFTRIELVKDEHSLMPDLSIVYQPSGLLVMMRVLPSVDPEGTKALRELILARHPQAHFQALPVTSGQFSLTIRYPNSRPGGEVDVIVPSSSGYVVPHFDPLQAAHLSLFFKPSEARLIVMALLGSGSLALNYEYSYRAAFTPTRASLNFDWNSIESSLPRVPPTGGLSERALASYIKDSVSNQTIQIDILEGRSDGAGLINQVIDFVSERCFTPIATASDHGSGLYSPNSHGCAGTSVSHISFEAPSTGELNGAAGFSVYQLCRRFPSLIRYKRGTSYQEGCPDRVYGLGEPDTLQAMPRQESVPAPIFH